MVNRKSYVLLVVFLIAILAFNANCCLNFDAIQNRCNQCPQNTRLFKGNCLFNVNNCQSYRKGIDCNKCQHGFKLVKVNDRVQCRKLQMKENDQFFQEQIDINARQPSYQLNKERLQFYQFLDDYFTKKYLEQDNSKRLLKIVDKMYTNGDHEVVAFYKTSKNVLKGVVTVVGNYQTFQLKSFAGAQKEDIPQNQIIEADSQEINQNSSIQGIKNHLNQTQNTSQIVQIPTEPKSQQQQKEQDQIKQTSDFNYEYQKKQSRQKDIGFETSNEYLKLSNTKILGQNAKVVGCFARTSGLRKNYRIFYKATNQQIYQGEVIYDVVKRRAYILNFGKQFTH